MLHKVGTVYLHWFEKDLTEKVWRFQNGKVDEIDEMDIHLAEYPAPFFQCNCSKERMGEVLRTIPIPARMDIVKDGKPLLLSCQFCNARYELSIDECTKAWNNQPLEG